MIHPGRSYQTITDAGLPIIEGLAFRGFRGESDFEKMISVIDRSKGVDGRDFAETIDDLKRQYEHLVNCDPATDMLFVEHDGEVIGYARVWWQQIVDGPRIYAHFAYLIPEWRGKEIRRAMVAYNEWRLRQIASGHETQALRYFEAWSSDKKVDWTRVLEKAGYQVVRYGFEMVRPDLDHIPDLPLPRGLEVRPVKPQDYTKVWSAAREAFRDHWGFSEAEWAETHFEAWQKDDTFDPDLWQVAWDGEEVAGMVLNFISRCENEEFGRQRGYTETICVRRPWRRRGLARALIARSLKLHRDLGMTEAALGVDAENPNGALHLYQSMGYETVKRHMTYRKPLDAEALAEERQHDNHTRTRG
ncbi:MAG: GNAT family N-acetyltransferase [Anaerolineae bacterium]